MSDPHTFHRLCEAHDDLVAALLFRQKESLAFALKIWNPDQPRAPAGSMDGGQWIGASTSASRAAFADRRSNVAFLAPYLIETYDMGPRTLCTYQSWPDSDRFVEIFPRGPCPQTYFPGFGPID